MWDRAEQVFRLVLFCGVLAWSSGARAAIEKFRGYVDLELNIGKPDGVELKSYYRMGTAGKGAVQLDLSYPLREFLFRNLDFYLYGQFFHGYGESLLSYDRKDTTVRVGLGLSR